MTDYEIDRLREVTRQPLTTWVSMAADFYLKAAMLSYEREDMQYAWYHLFLFADAEQG